MSKRRKKIYGMIKSSKQVGLGQNRPSAGFAYTTIPSDVDRTDYIREIHKTNRCMIVTEFNEIIKDVRVPNHLLQDLVFPQNVGEYGSMINWINVPKTNHVVIQGIFQKPGEMQLSKEFVWADVKSIDSDVTYSSTIDLNSKNKIFSMKNYDGVDGSISLIASSSEGSSRIKLYCDGKGLIELDDKLDVLLENELKIIVGSSEEEESTITVSKDGVFTYEDRYGNHIKIVDGELEMESKKIKLGEEAEQPVLKGDAWKSLEEKLMKAIQTITVPTALGPSGVPINSASFDEISSQLKDIQSTKTFTE